MSDVSTATSPGPKLALRAIVDHRLTTFPIKDGLLIGSDPDCDIRISDAIPKQIRIAAVSGLWRLYPAAPGVELFDYMNLPCAWLPLNLTTLFAVGKTIFDCVTYVEPIPIEDPPSLDRRACPRCRTNLAEIDLAAKFCPHCGAPLPADCPPWPPIGPPMTAPPPAWRIPRWLYCVLRKHPCMQRRSTTVLAYVNTLFNLGLRHDAGVDRDRNSEEAMRYYRKAAHLGNVPARIRLRAKKAPLVPSPSGRGLG